jgi:hypothetical protein
MMARPTISLEPVTRTNIKNAQIQDRKNIQPIVQLRSILEAQRSMDLAAYTIRSTIFQISGITKPKFSHKTQNTVLMRKHISPNTSTLALFPIQNGSKRSPKTPSSAQSPNIQVRQIAPDMTHEYSGPTGFFC